MKASPCCVVNLVDRADVGMIQRRSSLGLALKTGKSLRIFGNVIGQKLKGNKPAKLHVFRLVDNTHPTAAEFVDDAIVGDSLADHAQNLTWAKQASQCTR